MYTYRITNIIKNDEEDCFQGEDVLLFHEIKYNKDEMELICSKILDTIKNEDFYEEFPTQKLKRVLLEEYGFEEITIDVDDIICGLDI